jgi:CRISPR/Cas system CMR-associated protein Cmr3 (group 5 of RAMP superfamily)
MIAYKDNAELLSFKSIQREISKLGVPLKKENLTREEKILEKLSYFCFNFCYYYCLI